MGSTAAITQTSKKQAITQSNPLSSNQNLNFPYHEQILFHHKTDAEIVPYHRAQLEWLRHQRPGVDELEIFHIPLQRATSIRPFVRILPGMFILISCSEKHFEPTEVTTVESLLLSIKHIA